MLHSQGRLGFHQPFVPDEIESGDVQLLRDTFSASLLAVSSLLEMQSLTRSSGLYRVMGRPMNSNIVMAILETPPSNMRYVSTLHDLMPFKIHLIDSKEGPMNADSILQLCANMIHWEGPQDDVFFMNAYHLVSESGRIAPPLGEYEIVTHSVEVDVDSETFPFSSRSEVDLFPFFRVTCRVLHMGFGSPDWLANVSMSGVNGNEFFLGYASSVHALPGGTPLKDLAD